MTRFFFTSPGETLTPAQIAAGFVAVPAAPPTTAPAAGYTWELGDPQAVQVNGVWQQNWVQVVVPLATAQAQAIAQVGAIYLEKIAAGFTYNGVTVGILPADIQNITAMAATAMANIQAASLGITAPAWPSNFAWLPQGSGASLPLTAPEMITFGAAASHYVSSLILYADSLIAQIQAATTASAVQAIDITAGWPTS